MLSGTTTPSCLYFPELLQFAHFIQLYFQVLLRIASLDGRNYIHIITLAVVSPYPHHHCPPPSPRILVCNNNTTNNELSLRKFSCKFMDFHVEIYLGKCAILGMSCSTKAFGVKTIVDASKDIQVRSI